MLCPLDSAHLKGDICHCKIKAYGVLNLYIQGCYPMSGLVLEEIYKVHKKDILLAFVCSYLYFLPLL